VCETTGSCETRCSCSSAIASRTVWRVSHDHDGGISPAALLRVQDVADRAVAGRSSIPCDGHPRVVEIFDR
jgi:hypothetical protein